MEHIRKFNDFTINLDESFRSLDFLNTFGPLNESHAYYDSVSSALGKMMTYSRNNYKLQSSSLNEDAKRVYDRDIYFNGNERIGASMIANEMYNRFIEEANAEIRIYDAIINGEIEILDEGLLDSIKKWGENIKDVSKEEFKKLKDKVLDKSSDVAEKVVLSMKGAVTTGVKKIKMTKDDIVDAAKKMKAELTDKLKNLYELIVKFVKKGISTVKEMMSFILDAFSRLGENILEVSKNLGIYKLDKGEKVLEITYPEGVEMNMKTPEDKNLCNHIYEFSTFIIEKDKDSAEKLMEEGIKDIFNNEYIVWAKSMVSSVSISTWKTIAFSLISTIVVRHIDDIVGIFCITGAACPVAVFCAAFVSCLINIKGLIKLIKERNAQRKPGEKFFDTKTAIFFGISLLSCIMSTATMVGKFGPALATICRKFGIIDSTEGFAGKLAQLAKRLEPLAAARGEGHWVDNGKTNTKVENVTNTKVDMDVATVFGKKDASLVNRARKLLGLEGGVGVNDKVLPGVGTYGANGLIAGGMDHKEYRLQLIEQLKKLGCDAKHAAELADHVYLKDVSDVIEKDEHVKDYVAGALVPLTSRLPFLPTFIPFLSKKTWGTYKMRFASATRGYPAYTVEKSEIISKEDVGKLDGGEAVKTLLELHDESWNNALDIIKKENEGKDIDDVKKEEPGFIVVYVNKNKDTQNEDDKAKKKDDEKSKKNGTDVKTESKDDIAAGIIIDPLTLMCADVCVFNKRRRKQPYFLKGVFNNLSFRPVKDNDNDSKEFIRTKLFGDTLSSCIRNCVLYGNGRKYVSVSAEDSDDKKKKKEPKLKASVRETVFDTKDKVDAKKELTDIGYLTPEEMVNCLNDFLDNGSTKKCYDLLDGENATNIHISVDKKTGKKKMSVSKDLGSIENKRYYKLSDDELKTIENAYKEKLEKYEAFKKLSKEDKEKERKKYEEEKKKYDDMTPSERRKKGIKKPLNYTKKPVEPKFDTDSEGNKYKEAASKAIRDKIGEDNLKDYVDIKITPILKDKNSKVHKKLADDKIISKILFKDGKVNDDVITVLKPFLYRPEKTFSQNDEYELKKRLNDDAHVEGERLSNIKFIRKIKNLFKDEEQEHDTFKRIVEIIWDELSGERRGTWSDLVDNHPEEKKKSESIPESVEYENDLIYLFESFEYDEEYDEHCNEEYDEIVLEMRENSSYQTNYIIPSFSEFLQMNK